MPLLDPPLQYYLCSHFPKSSSKSNLTFFIHYLYIAMNYRKFNLKTFEASIQFMNDLQNNLPFINTLFKSNLKESSHFNKHQKNDNYYETLYNNINQKYKKEATNNVQGNYYTYEDNYKINLFQSYTFFPKNFCWYFTDSPIAYLCINLCQSHDNFGDMFSLINLDIDIITGCGYYIALIVIVDTNMQALIDLLHITIQTHKDFISEIHFNLLTEINSKDINNKVYELLLLFYQKIMLFLDFYLGYIYIYTPFYYDNTITKIIKKECKNSRITLIQFSEKIENALKFGKIHEHYNFCNKDSDSFYYSKPSYIDIGFKSKVLRIFLSNVSLYNTDDPENDKIPSCSSEFNCAYILKKNFSKWMPKRTPILLQDSINNNHVSQKFINFDDIHIIHPEFYVINTLYLANTDGKTHKSVDSIQRSANKKLSGKKKDDFKKKNFFSLFKENKIKKGLKYITYAYQNYRSTSNETFHLHRNQIFTAFEACKTCLMVDKSKDKKDKIRGVVYQVKTGEGKSCISQIVAAVLALSNKTVHVTSSNINLANRDYCDSFNFFDSIGLKSAVLLHQNEIPVGENISTFYSKEYYDDSLFENSSRMNYSICENSTKNKPNIIFSNFVNFESLYLRFMELSPGYIDYYFNNCSLIIDEADSILIDELTNGTILSRPMRSNGKDILFYVYRSYNEKKNTQEVYNYIKEKWPKCTDLNENDIKEMYKEIEIINQPEFTNGKKYSVETIKAKPPNKKDDDMNDDFIFDEDNICDGIEHKKIVPFDYDHKGILEPNKEFSGFIQQFIAIKEMENNKEEYKNMLIKNTSMNYLYVSHPIFANLYNGICGLTGTIGNSYDKKIFKEQYHLITKKIPSDKPNHMIELPIILCSNLKERNEKIVNEIIGFHKKEYPVLVIFQNLNEITEIANLLFSKGLRVINIFDGKKKDIKPDNIAGKKGAISLGTNFCGRGTDIKQPDKPLHVVVSYFTSNKRIMQQAYGRTARQGSDGTVRVICLFDEYISPKRIKDENSTKIILEEYSFKNQKQREFIEEFRKDREWIFDGHIKSQNINKDTIIKLREARINVNRINAFKFEFPICMSIDTFLEIQAQKIFSIFNCPNCKYTWMLFQKYIREMILESWSIFIEQIEKKYRSEKPEKSYKDYLEEEFQKLKNKLYVYLPQAKLQHSECFDIVPTYMHIFNIVVKRYQKSILEMLPQNMDKLFAESVSNRFVALFVGFRPYSLIDFSGARINTIDNKEQSRCFITDPELKYLKKYPDGNKIGLMKMSITEKVDKLFERFCSIINNLLGTFVGLKFFLRRTLGGCEFGICLDMDIEYVKNLNDYNCIIDKDPLLVFTISVKSAIPILAGILIIIIIMAKKIVDIFKNANPTFFVEKGIELVLLGASKLCNDAKKKLAEKLIVFLENIMEKQLEKMDNDKIGLVFSSLFQISKNKDFAKESKLIKNLFGNLSFFKLKSNFLKRLTNAILPVECLIHIGFLILIILASLMFSFYQHRKSLKYSPRKTSEIFERDKNVDKAIAENKDYVQVEYNET